METRINEDLSLSLTDNEDYIVEEEHHHQKDVAMPAVGKTRIFPRKDNIYKHKESIAYDEI